MGKYYEIETYMNFRKTVYVPVDSVADYEEAKELVAGAVETAEIDLLGSDDFEAGEIFKKVIEAPDDYMDFCSVIGN